MGEEDIRLESDTLWHADLIFAGQPSRSDQERTGMDTDVRATEEVSGCADGR